MFVVLTAKVSLNNSKKFIMANMAAGQKGAIPSPPGQQIVVAGKSSLDGSKALVVHTADKKTVGEIVDFYYKWMGQLQDVPGLEFSIDVYEDIDLITSMLGIPMPKK